MQPQDDRMELVEWDEKFSVGIREIDAQHKKLFRIINSVFEGITENRTHEVVKAALDDIIDYTRYHFSTEERLFEKYKYPDAEQHKKQHMDLLEQVTNLQSQFAEDAPGVSVELLDLLTRWLQEHILHHDQHYAPFLKAGREAVS